MSIDTSGVKEYLSECRALLGDTWVASADNASVDGVRNVGGAVKDYAMSCYIKGTKPVTCVNHIKKKFPEIKE